MGWCGSRGEPQEVIYSQPATYTVDSAAVANTSSDGFGYDPSVYPMRGSDVPVSFFDVIHSDTDSKGQTGPGIGTLPEVEVLYIPEPPEETDANKATFSPRAMVMFQDSRKTDENDFLINRQFFESENLEKNMYGSSFNQSIIRDGGSAPRGTLLRYLYNERENTITFYYRDTITNQWIISTEPYNPTSISNASSLESYMGKYIMPTTGHKFIYKWNLFKRTGII